MPGFRKAQRRRRATPAVAEARMTMADLERAVAAAEAPVYLVAPRVLRRVVREHRQLTGLQLDVPHGDVYGIAREPLLGFVELDELGLETGAGLPEQVILVTRPEPGVLEAEPGPAILTRYWRLIFHGMVHLAADERAARGELSEGRVRCWVRRLGTERFAEITEVLRQEEWLAEGDGLGAELIEGAAVFWEFYYFAPSTLLVWFPGLGDLGEVSAVFGELADPEPLLAASRPAGARRPARHRPVGSLADLRFRDHPDLLPPHPPPGYPSPPKYRKLVGRAGRARARGNQVRALVLGTRARSWAPKEAAGRARAAVRHHVDALAGQLLKALDAARADPDTWHEPLMGLVQRAAHGFWTVEARLLYDLQKVCLDRQRRSYRLDLAGWLTSLGRRPLRRPLPHQENVLICRHLRSARRRLARVRLPEGHLRHLDELLAGAGERAEELIRSEMRPVIRRALEAVGLCPENLPERVAVEKLVEELLDRIVHRGFLTLGDLRDGLARNSLKLHDLGHLATLVHGDQLLRVDRQLARELERVHRRGQFYLRWMQSVSSVAFATPWGRVLTRYLAVPFGGAYVLEAGLQHVLHKVTRVEEAPSPLAVFLLGVFFLGLLNSARFRTAFRQLVRGTVRAIRLVLVQWPQRVLDIPVVRRVLHSPWVRSAYRFGVKPFLVTALIGLSVSRFWPGWHWSPSRLASVFLGSALVLNSRLGRDMEEIATDWLLAAWQRLGLRLLVALFEWIMDLSRKAIDAVDRFLYAVDEWLRFRTGEGRAVLALKAVLTPPWSVANYVVRFCVTLLIEPQVNPIKHFPVVTVSHKILLPFIPAVAGVLSMTMDKATAYFTAGTTIAMIPGAFGFLVWELRENWKLYRANRPERLLPVPVGPHGETVERLLKRGFHSGTIPKRFARLRHAERRARTSGNWGPVRGHLQVLHELEQAVRRFVERDLLALLRHSGAWAQGPFAVVTVRLGTNRILVELSLGQPPGGHASLRVDCASDYLLADFAAPDWLPQLALPQQRALENALAGWYRSAGIDFLRESIQSCLARQVAAYQFKPGRMVLWIGPGCETEAVWEFGENRLPAPHAPPAGAPFFEADADLDKLALAAAALPFQDWADAWDRIAQQPR